MNSQIDEVLSVIGDDPKLRRRVEADLKRSGSVEATINNFFEGQLAADPQESANPTSNDINQPKIISSSSSAAPIRSISAQIDVDLVDDLDGLLEPAGVNPYDNDANIDILDTVNDDMDVVVAGAEFESRPAARPVTKKRARIASLYDDDSGLDADADQDAPLGQDDDDSNPPPARKRSKASKASDDNADDVVPKPRAKKAASSADGEPKRRRQAKATAAAAVAVDPAQALRDKIANVPPKKQKKVGKDEALTQMRLVFDTSFVNDARTSALIQWVQRGGVKTEARELKRPGVIEWHRDETESLGAARMEPFVLIAISTVNFAEMLKQSAVPSPALSEYVDRLQSQYPTAKFLSFALWGVSEYYAETQNVTNREYTARAQNDAEKLKKAMADKAALVPKSRIEQSIVWLQINRKCRIRKIETVGDLGNYILKLTEQVAIKPYKPPPAFANFCAEAAGGRQRAARTVGEAWKQALTRINGLSDRMADAIMTRFSTMRSLLETYDKSSKSEGENLLATIEYTGDKTTRKIGPVMSKTIYLIFTSKDGSQFIK